MSARNTAVQSLPQVSQAEPALYNDGPAAVGGHLIGDAATAASGKRALRLYEAVIAQSSDMISLVDSDYHICLANHRFGELHGCSAEQMIGRHVASFVGEEEFLAQVKPAFARCFNGEQLRYQRPFTNRDGKHYYLDVVMSPLREPDGTISGAAVTTRDVSEAQRLSQQLNFQARHDDLTGLPNRSEFKNRLQQCLDEARSDNNCVSATLCYIDLDQFKIVNDTAGHAAGDQLLIQVTELFKQQLRDGDLLARLGGDEFGLLMYDRTPSEAENDAIELLGDLRDFRLPWRGQLFEISASAGLVAIDRHSDNVEDLMSHADLACYTAKDLGRNRLQVYSENDNQLVQRRSDLYQAADLRNALEQYRFCLYGQTILPLTAGAEPHYEILIRLRDGKGGVVAPGAFIPAAERFGMMAALDRWVVDTVLTHYRALFPGDAQPRVSINVSGQSLADELFLGFVRARLADNDVLPSRLCFEITETAMVSQL